MTNRNELKDAVREARELIEATTEVTADGRRMAEELIETIRSVADLQCGAIELRANDIRARLIELENKLEAA